MAFMIKAYCRSNWMVEWSDFAHAVQRKEVTTFLQRRLAAPAEVDLVENARICREETSYA
jgi:hypothetical protein